MENWFLKVLSGSNWNSRSLVSSVLDFCNFDFLQVAEPPVRKAGGFVADVPELVQKLKEKGFVKGWMADMTDFQGTEEGAIRRNLL